MAKIYLDDRFRVEIRSVFLSVNRCLRIEKGGGVGMVHKYQHVLGVMVEALTCVYVHSGIVLSFVYLENVLDYLMFYNSTSYECLTHMVHKVYGAFILT